jgi:DNA-binding transcriptional ArsR family regulator
VLAVPTGSYDARMSGDADVAAVAGLLGDRARAAICLALLDGRYRPAGELARLAGVTASTASEHLGLLRGAGLLEVTAQGRHRYYRLAGPDVAAAVEALSVLARPQPVRSLRQSAGAERLRAGRTCYDHLAGRLGVTITDALVEAGVLTPELGLADPGPLIRLGVELTSGSARRPTARPCLDWTERRHHVAGALPAAFTARLFELGWLRRPDGGRAVRLTADGGRGLADVLDCAALLAPA